MISDGCSEFFLICLAFFICELGFETRAKREYRAKKFVELKEIENLLFKKGFFDKVREQHDLLIPVL